MSQTDAEMILLQCGKCQRNLRVASSLLGRRIRCPKCKTALQVPELTTVTDSEDDYFPDWLKFIVMTPILLIVLGIISFIIGKPLVIALTIILSCIALLIWKREFIQSLFEQWEHQVQLKATMHQSTPKVSASEVQTTSSTTDIAVDIDHLFEIQTQSPTTPKNVSNPAQSTGIKKVSRWLYGTSEADVTFYGPGTTAIVDNQKLDTPLIYLVPGTLNQPYDASLIETGLPVAKSGRGAYPLPYWPSYRQCSPEQRRNYLNWLTSGRCEANIELGYVFIYFYGLERRIIQDCKDTQAIIQELLRLLPIYKSSRSFQRYCSSLLWMAAITTIQTSQLRDELLRQIIDATEFWSEANLSALLSIYEKQNLPLPPDVAFLVTEHDSRSPRSVVFKRHPEKFRALFSSRFSDEFKNGFRLKASKRDYNYDYRPASESLIRIQSRFSQNRTLLPNTLGIPSQFKPLIQIWSEVIDDLKSFDRVQRKSNTDQVLTADVYEALPEELRNDDHPDSETWYQIIDQNTDDSAGVAFVPVSQLATARGISERSKLTKKQCEQILNSADCMDLCLEPDSRETGQNYRWDEFVSIFPREHDSTENLKSYHAASILLRLGMSIAAADGTVDKDELALITIHLEQQFDLSPQESVRLEHLSLLLSRYPVDDTRLATKLQELPETQRNLIGDLLVGIASADEIITPDECKALKKTFRNLKLDPTRIDRLSDGVVSLDNDSSSEDELVLNHDRIREIMSETSQVAEFLQNVMVEDEEAERVSVENTKEPDLKGNSNSVIVEQAVFTEEKTEVKFESGPENNFDISYVGLDARYHTFLEELLSRSHWSLSELETNARSQGLMLMGAIEAINEWSLETLGDWLIDESDNTAQIATDLINKTS
ncbi:TerB N-terminal domain-containing protein [Gimesia sp.]|uniref:tellurite resistance TerB family protein n=1 Tax=Gimesia sp. TaxID=2024833 RepID=UPI003A93654B